jgi:hypothetical protein
MQRSGPRNPCPCCGRTKTSHCAWVLNGSDEDLILCHEGERWGPPPGLSIGDTIEINHRSFALTAVRGGFAGSAHAFRPHKPKEKHLHQLPRQIRKANEAVLDLAPLNAVSLEDQFDSLHRDIKVAFSPSKGQDIYCLLNDLECLRFRAVNLLPRLKRAQRSDPTLCPLVEELSCLLSQVQAEVKHLQRCSCNPVYAQAFENISMPTLKDHQSHWAYWQQQKALRTHPWVIESKVAKEQFWYDTDD